MEYFHSVHASDIQNYGEIACETLGLSLAERSGAAWIITNPAVPAHATVRFSTGLQLALAWALP